VQLGSQANLHWRRSCGSGVSEPKAIPKRTEIQSKQKEDVMKRNQLLSAVGIMVFVTCSLAAQDQGNKPATLASIEFQKVKATNVPQYEAGRKQKAAWHKQQNDPLPLLVWETMSGDNTGTFLVGHFDQHWADYDKPAITDEADLAEFQKVMGAYVDSVVTRYYEYMPKISNESGDKTPTKFSEILTFQVRPGKESDFRSALERIHEGTVTSNWNVNYGWYDLVDGGMAGTFVLSFPHKNWADFEDHPDVKPYRDMLKDAFGQAEADSIVDRLDRSIEKETMEIIQFRLDLSYIPGK
jgi:quinol monooxygenase YgiN